MLSFLYVYSDHSILECYNLFSGVELSMRSFLLLTSSRSLTKLLFFLFVLQFFLASESEFWNSKLVIVSAESLESKYSAMLIFSNWFTRGVIYFSLISSCENLD